MIVRMISVVTHLTSLSESSTPKIGSNIKKEHTIPQIAGSSDMTEQRIRSSDEILDKKGLEVLEEGSERY